MWLKMVAAHQLAVALPQRIGPATARIAVSFIIQLLEYPIPPRPSQKPRVQWISGTARAIIDPLVSKRPETNLKKYQ